MERKDFPILEFDETSPAIISPAMIREKTVARNDVPPCCVITFFSDMVNRMLENGEISVLFTLRSEGGDRNCYLYRYKGRQIGLFSSPVGAPAAAGFMEELIAMGMKKFVASGGAGVLNKEIAVGHLVVPSAGVRDEGTSYHYIPLSREAFPTEKAYHAVTATLSGMEIPFIKGKTWTTDGFYRETKDKYNLRREEGCVTVEMEFTALCALARFRGVEFAQILYGGDDLTGDIWDKRGWHDRHEVRRNLIDLSCECCFNINE